MCTGQLQQLQVGPPGPLKIDTTTLRLVVLLILDANGVRFHVGQAGNQGAGNMHVGSSNKDARSLGGLNGFVSK